MRRSSVQQAMAKPRRRPPKGRPTPTQDQRSARTRAAILAAAEAEFAAEGLSGARTDAIARTAGVNKAMLYYHFESKQALYEAVIDDHFREFNRQAMAVLESDGPAGRVLMQYVAMHFDFISSRHRYASLYQHLMMGGGGFMEKIVRRYFAPRAQAVDRLLARGQRTGQFRRTHRAHTSISIAALIVFYFSASKVMELLHQGADPYSKENLRLRKEEVMRFIQFALFTHPREDAP
ncbi:MAG TPA: TetR/AcrR family transcriptional regulator [Phycisphaerae bacterium]|nr:TetR/AcrR family transcriptional regulator [Phycisphaerae bacterium]